MAAVEKWKKKTFTTIVKNVGKATSFYRFLPFFSLARSNVEQNFKCLCADGGYLAKGNIIWTGRRVEGV